MTTKETLDRIRQDAEVWNKTNYWPEHDSKTPANLTVAQVKNAFENAYISGATKERERAKALVEALEKVILEDELGIVATSGKYLAKIAKQAIENYKK